MDFQVAFMLLLLGATFVVFALELMPLEVTALCLLGVLIVFGLVSPRDAISGFSNPAVVAIGALFVLGFALGRTGLIDFVADRVGRWAEHSRWLGIGLLLIAISLLSGFLNNTAIVAVFIPLAMRLCSRLELSPSRLLIPVSYASIFGGTLTLIGTSTNLIVSGVASTAGERPFGMFEFTRLGLVFLALGMVYVVVVGPRVLPERVPPTSLARKYELGEYLAEVRVSESSALVGTSLAEARLGERYGIDVLALIRGEERHAENLGVIPLMAGDLLVVHSGVDDLLRARGELDISLAAGHPHDADSAFEGALLAEVLVPPNSRLLGRSLRDFDFRRRFGAIVVGIRRHGVLLRGKLAGVLLRTWDALLAVVPADRLDSLRASQDLVVLAEHDVRLGRQRLWWLTMGVLPVVILLSALGVLEISVGALLGAVVLVVARVVSPQEAYRAVDWSVIFLIAAFVPVGRAIIDTGTADFIARQVLWVADLVPFAAPFVVLSLLYLVTSLLTEIASNAAAAIVLTPIAISLAMTLNVDARPFLIAVCFAASASFMTPMGYQTNMMVYAPGGYRFVDYVRFGGPLNLLFWITASVTIPWMWQF
jgi:di/tricarboxylate transporter